MQAEAWARGRAAALSGGGALVYRVGVHGSAGAVLPLATGPLFRMDAAAFRLAGGGDEARGGGGGGALSDIISRASHVSSSGLEGDVGMHARTEGDAGMHNRIDGDGDAVMAAARAAPAAADITLPSLMSMDLSRQDSAPIDAGSGGGGDGGMQLRIGGGSGGGGGGGFLPPPPLTGGRGERATGTPRLSGGGGSTPRGACFVVACAVGVFAWHGPGASHALLAAGRRLGRALVRLEPCVQQWGLF